MMQKPPDEELAEKAQAGSSAAQDELINRYKAMVRLRSRMYFITGADMDDITQEGMIGLFKAIRDYRPGRASFATFAQLCVNRQILTAIKASMRQKHQPLNTAVPEAYAVPIVTHNSPEQLIISREEKIFIESNLGKLLSNMELRVLAAYLGGRSYAEIGFAVGCNEKAVENALSRVRRKLQKLLIAI